ncbi:hypothetical protein BH11BAC4_BH11BAC4_26680 [soil metagenome]
MNYFSKIILIASLISICTDASAQGLAEGYFTSEALLVPTANGSLVSIKKYNPTQAEIDNAGKPSRNSPMNYLMAPYDACNISMYSKDFESKLYSFDNKGKVSWDMTIGYSNKSVTSPVKIYKDHIYTGEGIKDKEQVMVQKVDMDGKIIWKAVLDSLENVNDIYVDSARVSVLVSFDISKKITNNNGTFSEHVYPIYFFVQFDIYTGKRIVKLYQNMANYLSSLDFKDPLINTDFSYYMNNSDSAAFMRVDKQEAASIVSQDMSRNHSIIQLKAGTESYHLLTLLSSGRNKKTYSLISDFYGKEKKYEAEIPVPVKGGDRSFIYLTAGDTIATVISNAKNINVFYTDITGKTWLYKRIDEVISPVAGTAVSNGKTYILQVEGRVKPGVVGKLKFDLY